MPIYEYTCDTCEVDFEELVQNTAVIQNIKCPECQSTSVERKLSVFGFSSSGSSRVPGSNSSGCSTCASKNCASCH